MELTIGFPHLRGDEKAGDPCPCGCGGVKILPHNPNARKLSISSPCQTCGKGRIYEAGENSAGFVYGPHSPLCHPCSQQERIRYRKGASVDSAFQTALLESLKRKEVTLKQACATAGIRERTVLSWIRGDFVPRRDSLEQLAAVLDAPALIATITSRIGRITVTCPDCGKVRSYKSSNFKREIERYNRPISAVNWETRTASYLCTTCNGRRLMQDYNRKQMKRHGLKPYVERGRRMRAMQTPEQHAMVVEMAAAKRRGKARSEESRRNQSVAQISPRPVGRFGLCRICTLIVYSRNQDSRAQAHAICLSQWKHDHKRAFTKDAYPPRPRGHTPSATELSISFEMCVLHLIRGESIGESDLQDGKGLAALMGMSRRSVIDRIKGFLKRLPTDGRGGKKLARWSDVLLDVARAQGYKV